MFGQVEAVARLNRGIALTRDKGDNGTKALLEKILLDEEKAIDWLETQLDVMQKVGIQNWLQSQM